MSEMQRNRGIVKRLSNHENIKEVYANLDIDKKYDEVNEEGVPTWIEDDRYDIVDGDIFDVSGAPDEYDADDEVNEAVKLNDTDYRVHAYYYNGGASFSEMLDSSIPQADVAFAPKTSKEIIKEALAKAHVDELEAMLIVTEIFEDERKKQ